jgi:hypothetical protein
MNPIGPYSLADQRRPISVVAAGILPAVEPGILPGGKTARRKAQFPSHRLVGSWKASFRIFACIGTMNRIDCSSRGDPFIQSQRDCALQPKVAERARLPWVLSPTIPSIPMGLCPPHFSKLSEIIRGSWKVPRSIRTFSAVHKSEGVVMPDDEEIMTIAQRGSLAPQRGEGLRVRGESTPVQRLLSSHSSPLPLSSLRGEGAALGGLCYLDIVQQNYRLGFGAQSLWDRAKSLSLFALFVFSAVKSLLFPLRASASPREPCPRVRKGNAP